MGTLLNSESRRLYSWWWDSHMSPKNSKWLQDNLTDMDGKVKAMIKLIEEDADSFARRAEMYYKKRPELMKLVEEFYRAYRALAERYDHATGELRQAHRTMSQAFPDLVLGDDTPSNSEPDTPETPRLIHALFDPDQFQGLASSSQGMRRTGAPVEESDKGISRKGLKQLNDIFRSGEGVPKELKFTGCKVKPGLCFNDGKVRERNLEGDFADLSNENQMLKGQLHSESDRVDKDEFELYNLREALAKQEAEKEAISLLYQQSLNKLSTLVKDFNHAVIDSKALDEDACKAKAEILALKEAIKKLEAERDASLLQYQLSLEKLAVAEDLVLKDAEDAKRLSEQAMKAETECQHLNQELDRLKAEKEVSELLYHQHLDKIAELEKKLALADENLNMINERSEKAESEVRILKDEIRKLNEERDTVCLQYKLCLETISKLHRELNEMRADNGRLNSEILLSSANQRGAEDQCALMGQINESLKLEAQNLAQKIAAADQELSRKQSEMEQLLASLRNEQSRFLQAEATLQTLQNLHSQSQEDQRTLALELRNGLQMIKNLEICEHDLKVEVQQLKDENQTLNDLNLSSSISQMNLQNEMSNLKEMKEKLEAEVRHQIKQSDTLQFQVHSLKGEIEGLYKRYEALMQQVVTVGLDPDSFSSSVKGLQDENLRLKEISLTDKADREALMTKLQDIEELLKRNAILESSLLEVNVELQRSNEKAKALQESCCDHNEEKSTLVSERASLLSQLQIITETMQNLLEKNASLQTSLCGATAELEGLRAKSRGLEELCQLLRSERSDLLSEKSSLVSRLEIVEKKLEKLEIRFTNLEDKYAGLEKEKQSTVSQVEELRFSLDVEKKNRTSLLLTSEARLSGLEGRVHDLQEENKYRKGEFEEQLKKAVNAQVEIFILQKFIQDMEDKNFSLWIECQRQVEADKYSEKLIAELENENRIHEVEAEIMMEKIEMLKEGISQVLKALEIKHESETQIDFKFVPYVLANIRSIKDSLSECRDENQHLQIEKSILSTLLEQLYLECAELSSKKTTLEQESLLLSEQLVMLEDDKQNVLERNRQLNLKLDERGKREEALKSEAENLLVKQVHLQHSYLSLEEEKLKAFEQNRFLGEELQKIKEEKHYFEEESSAILVDTLSFSYQSLILSSFGVEKVAELGIISEDLSTLGKAYKDLEIQAIQLEEKLLMKEIENLALKSSVDKLEEKSLELCAGNDQLRHQISRERELLSQKEKELSKLEKNLKDEQDLKADLFTTIQRLKLEHDDLEVRRVILEKKIVKVSDDSKCQEREIAYLHEANGSLESELGRLQEELEEHKIREVILASELHEKNSEFELWEAEAASFYFDLQISSVRESLFENKVYELGSLYKGLENMSIRRSLEIERMKMRVRSLESETGALKSQLTDISDVMEESLSPPDMLLELQKLQARIIEIENIMVKGKMSATVDNHANASERLKAAVKEIEDLKARINTNNHEEHRQSSREFLSEVSERKIGEEMKDIPLDQASGQSFNGVSHRASAVSEEPMLELWEAAEHDYHDLLISNPGTHPTENEIVHDQSGVLNHNRLDPSPESHFDKDLGVDTLRLSTNDSLPNKNKKIALERLASDSHKLSSLLLSVHELKGKIEPHKRRKKTEDAEFETIRGQLLEMENSIVQLMDINTELTTTIEESLWNLVGWEARELDVSESIKPTKLPDEARKEAEKIERLELEMQRIQYAFLRMMDAKKSKGKGAVSRSNAAILLRDFFYSRERKSKKPKKSRLCGCLRPTVSKT